MSHGELAHVHAAQERKRKQEEEEEMTSYTNQELSQDWEFKIVRSATGAFSKPEMVAQVREEESLTGWQLVEKFDNNRMRFKRPADSYKKDQEMASYLDPYRTQYGISDAGLGFRIVAVIMLFVGTLVFIANYYNL